jgi:hypothetical protein
VSAQNGVGCGNFTTTVYWSTFSTTATVSADLGGQTLVSGVYTGGALALTGTLTLDGQGDPNAVFIFQAASSLTTASGSRVSLTGGLTACNVYWKVGSSATLGTGSTFVGTILALTSITATTGAVIQGRLLARNGAVTLDTNTITRSACAAAPAATTTTTAADSATTVAGAGTATTAGGGGGAGSGGGTATSVSGATTGGSLSRTGIDALSTLIAGLGAVTLGAAALFVARRRVAGHAG